MSGKSSRVYVGNLAWRVRWQDLKEHMKSAGNVTRADVFEDRDGRSRGCGIVEFATPEEAQTAITKMSNTDLLGRQIFVREDREDEGGDASRRPLSGGGGRRGGGRGGGGRGGYGGSRGGPYSYGGGGGGYYGGNGGYDDGYDSYGGGYNDYGGGRRPRGGYGGYGQYGGGGDMGGYGWQQGRYGGGGGGGRGGGGMSPYGQLRDDNRGRQIFVGNLSWRTTWQELKDMFRECGDVERADVFETQEGRSKGCGTVVFADPVDAQKAVEKFNNVTVDGRDIAVRIDTGPSGRGDRRY